MSSLNRVEVIECLKNQLSIPFNEQNSLPKLKRTLGSYLCSIHPIHGFVDSLCEDDLKAIWNHFDFSGKYQKRKRSKDQIANFFLKKFPSCPLETLKSFLQTDYFNGIPMKNTGNQCYVIATANLLFSSDILSKKIDQMHEKQMHDKTMHDTPMHDK